jgi:hypothetical protein
VTCDILLDLYRFSCRLTVASFVCGVKCCVARAWYPPPPPPLLTSRVCGFWLFHRTANRGPLFVFCFIQAFAACRFHHHPQTGKRSCFVRLNTGSMLARRFCCGGVTSTQRQLTVSMMFKRSEHLSIKAAADVVRHKSHVTRHTSHVTRHTSHVMRHRLPTHSSTTVTAAAPMHFKLVLLRCPSHLVLWLAGNV